MITKKYFAYITKRILPFLVMFLTVETIMRFVFLMREWRNVKSDPGTVCAEILIGFAYDIGVFFYFLIPLGLYFCILRGKNYNGSTDRITSTVLFAILTYILLFTSISEWFFWDEFASRFNFIAVDYLVYTTEVIANITESYPVTPLLVLIGIVAGLSGYGYYYHFNKSATPLTSRPAIYQRFAFFLVTVILATISFYTFKSEMIEVGSNRYLHEIGKNGMFELFSAYRNNELSYHKFYVSTDEKDLRANVRSHLVESERQFSDDGITRHIDNAGPEKHYNIVLITVESLSAGFMKTFGNTENITPHLDKLADESLFFSNLYATGTRTVYGLSAITLSIPPIPGNSIVRRPQNENLFSLGSVLNKKGYKSKFLYGGYGYFDNMNYFFAHNGYDIVDRSSMIKDEISFSNAWGVADEDIFNHTITENDKTHATGKPFFDMIMTTSNHRPYTYPDGRIDLPSHSGRQGAVKYTDYAINKFINDSRSHPWFKNTIFVIIADHTAGSARKSELDPDGYHIPLFIYAPGIIKPRRVDSFASQIDLAPTLLGLLNMDYDTRFYGQDILKTSPNRAFISNYQQLGYITPDKLVVLKPVKQVHSFYKINNDFVCDPELDNALVHDGITYFQGATKWKEWNKAL